MSVVELHGIGKKNDFAILFFWNILCDMNKYGNFLQIIDISLFHYNTLSYNDGGDLVGLHKQTDKSKNT